MSIYIEDDELKQCRICFDDDHPDELISPYVYVVSYVHRKYY